METNGAPLEVVFRFCCRSTKGCEPTETKATATDEHHLLVVIGELRKIRKFCGHCGSQNIRNEIVIRRQA